MTVVVVAYMIEKGQGSEAGSGFGFVSEMLELYPDIILITRKNNAEKLRELEAFRSVKILGLDVPRSISFWKKKSHGTILYYYLWQILVARTVSDLAKTQLIELIHQYNFHTDWAAHFHRGDIPVVWGPICHQPRLPSGYLVLETFGGKVKEQLKWITKQAFWNCDPFLRRAIKRTQTVLYANDDIAPPFKRHAKDLQLQTFGGATFLSGFESARGSSGPLRLLHVGRMVSIKGAAVAIQALASCTSGPAGKAELILVGDGPLRSRLEELASNLEISHRVRFVPWVSQEDLVELYAAVDAFLYPSLGNQDTVVAEALAAGLPVLGIAGSGTETMASDAGLMAPRAPFGDTVAGLGALIEVLAADKDNGSADQQRRQEMSTLRSSDLSWKGTAVAIRERYP